MSTYRTDAVLSDDGILKLERIPFRAGDRVEVIVRSREPKLSGGERYPLRGEPVRYKDPMAGVAEDEWEAAQ
jgi:hypothetical protein